MIPFSPPRIDQKIIDEVVDALRSGWITTGPRTKRFEQMLKEFTGSRATVCLGSATAGLELVLRWFGIREGDEVILPAYTYAATGNVVIHCGAKVVLADSGPDFNISVDAVREAITPRTKAIIPVDIGGYPCDYGRINDLVNDPGIRNLFHPETPEQHLLGRILVLSDAAHSLGAVYQGKRTGTLTDITVFSFHAVKNLTTAEGGAVCLSLPGPFDNEKISAGLKTKSLHGQTKDAFSKINTSGWRYDIVEPGYKCNMTDIQAAMGIAELPRYEEDMLARRKEIFTLYTELLSAYPWAEVPVYETKEKKSSWHAYLLRIKGIGEKQRDEIIRRVFDREVAVNVHFVPLPLFTFYREAGYRMESFPVAFDNFSREVSLPVYYDLTDDQVRTVVSALAASVNEVIA